MSANPGVVFMRRPNRPYREPNEYDYQNYIWKDLAERILKKDEHTAGHTTVNELAVELESTLILSPQRKLMKLPRSGLRGLMTYWFMGQWIWATTLNLP